MTCRFKWVPQWENGEFWSLHLDVARGTELIPAKTNRSYFGYVCGLVASKPGGLEQARFKSMREAASQVLEWAKSESGQ